jgi:hypothetical protein
MFIIESSLIYFHNFPVPLFIEFFIQNSGRRLDGHFGHFCPEFKQGFFFSCSMVVRACSSNFRPRPWLSRAVGAQRLGFFERLFSQFLGNDSASFMAFSFSREIRRASSLAFWAASSDSLIAFSRSPMH